MQTRLLPSLLETSDGREADRILRSCVHCGFCTATCPTYQLLGDELDGPRGRIYQIKMMLEGEQATRTTQQHLDRCLTCLNCVTTCPSGVEYHKLVDIGRERVEQTVRRPVGERLMRWGLRKVVPYPRRFWPLLTLAQLVRPVVPPTLRAKVPRALSKSSAVTGSCSDRDAALRRGLIRAQRLFRGHGRGGARSVGLNRARPAFRDEPSLPRARGAQRARNPGQEPDRDPVRVPNRNPDWEWCGDQAHMPARDRGQEPQPAAHSRRVLMLENCVEPALTPATVEATVRVLSALGIEVLQPAGGGCCGAISQHLAAPEEAKGFMRRNIDAWWPLIAPANGDQPVEAILVTASGCGAVVKEYGWLLRDDPDYAAKAERVSRLTRDLSELLSADDLATLPTPSERGLPQRIAFHPPCTLQHGQGLMGRVEALLRAAGFELTAVRDAHSCCGSAGTYSILQADLSERLRADRLDALQSGEPALIATANVGCQTHLAAAAGVPVRHWIELFDPGVSLASEDQR